MGIAAIIAAALGAVGSLLSSLKGAGVNVGSAGDLVLKDVLATETDEANYLAGQAVPIQAFSYQNEPGTVLIVKNGGPAAASIGL